MDLVKAIKRIMAYSYWTRNLTLCYKKQTNVKDIYKARAWVDAAYIDCPESLRSTGGQLVTVNGCPVSCESKRQPLVTLGHENWDDMVQRVESVTTAGDDIDDPKLYASGDSALRGKGGHHK